MATETPDPGCFGRLEIVFPPGADGLRHTPRGCLACRVKTACLRQAMEGRAGLAVREEAVDRAYRAGALGFLERWSRKKALHRRRTAPGMGEGG
jgi:hypothetical protein